VMVPPPLLLVIRVSIGPIYLRINRTDSMEEFTAGILM